ncbi:hypothetical protein TNCV_278821 [Trichonephila clavipes]|nr:hypothetical protein TNCV_278821 [Trichonephila clavipes]
MFFELAIFGSEVHPFGDIDEKNLYSGQLLKAFITALCCLGLAEGRTVGNLCPVPLKSIRVERDLSELKRPPVGVLSKSREH